jgi:hypothetical protein
MRMRNPWLLTALAIALVVGTITRVDAEPFKSAKECVPGKRVADAAGKTGTVVAPPKGDPVGCSVRMDADSQPHYFIFWMLHAAGGSAETNDKLVPGKYECFAGGHYTFMDMYITGPNSYSAAGTHGTFTVYKSRKIVFHGGSLARNYAHLLAGPAIGLNTTGESFYATTCELKK